MMGQIIAICHRFVVTKEIEVDYIKIFDHFKAGKQSPATASHRHTHKTTSLTDRF